MLPPAESLPDTYYFLHIPKTAGTSFRVALENQFPLEKICNSYEFFDIKQYSSEQLARFRLFRGHMGYNLANYLPEMPKILCMLRNPIERSISHFEYVQRDPRNPRHAEIHSRKLDLAGYLRDELFGAELRNAQTRPLCHISTREQLRTLLAHSDSQQDYARLWRSSSNILPPVDEMLDIAKSRLELMFFVGVAERMAESLAQVHRLFGARAPAETQALNINPRRTSFQDLPSSTQDLLLETCQLDLQLYQFAQELFDRAIEQSTPPPDKQLSYAPTNDGSVSIDFHQPLYGTGWHQRELVPGVGIVRWTGPSKVSDLDIALDATKHYQLIIETVDSVDDNALKGLSIQVNGVPTEQPRIAQQLKGRVLVTTSIPPRMLANLNRVSICLLEVGEKHADQTTAVDHNHARRVGLAVLSIKLLPMT